jgi:RNA polymerase sigma-70 factor (ECF subfamily)
LEPSTEADGTRWVRVIQRIAADRDREAFAELYDHFTPRVSAYLRRQGAQGTAGDDLVQEVMLAVWRKAAQFDATRAAPSTWLFRIARNQLIDSLRKQNARGGDQAHQSVDDEETASALTTEQVETGDDNKILRLMTELPKLQNEVIYASYFLGQSHGEIADSLAIPLGSVKSNLRLAFQKLRASLGVAL